MPEAGGHPLFPVRGAVWRGELTYLDGRPFCPACLKEYIEEYGRAHTGEFADGYIEANLDERAADFWENDLDEQAKKKLLREVYRREKRLHRAAHLHLPLIHISEPTRRS